MDRRLGRPLPHQLPNPTRANPSPINLSSEELIRYSPQFPRTIPNQRARSHALLTRPPLTPKGSLDLHVLGLPPAFVLSQDQTLKLKGQSLSLTSEPLHISTCIATGCSFCSVLKSTKVNKNRKTVKLTLTSSETSCVTAIKTLASRYDRRPIHRMNQTVRISLQKPSCQKAKPKDKTITARHKQQAQPLATSPDLSASNQANPVPPPPQHFRAAGEALSRT